MLSLDSVTNIDTFSFYLNNIECGFKNSLLNLNSDSFLHNIDKIYDFPI